MTKEETTEKKEETQEEVKEETQEEAKEEAPAESEETEESEDISEEEEAKLPFPMAPVVRIMKRKLDNDKMIKKEVKVAMNKWLGAMCERVARTINKYPYSTVHLHEFNESRRVYESLEEFEKEKKRILAHLCAIRHDINRLERDLGKVEDELS